MNDGAWFLFPYIGYGAWLWNARKEFVKLPGIVEAETFIGGEDRNCHAENKSHGRSGIDWDKVGVIGTILRKANFVCQVIDHFHTATLTEFGFKVDSDRFELIEADENFGYEALNVDSRHHAKINHSRAR